ncbi:AraC family transcriptional regulator [Undibacterium sp. SXout7W]|uniref:AraC family transcriptional regulator n=1 Tax=Undibacterium sp. SXout7W TaxID=3413049 RepID=UPI003BF0D038
MPVHICHHTNPHPPESDPTPARPIRLVARNLQLAQNLIPHEHDWGQLTYTPQGMLQVVAEGSIWFVPPMRAIWIPPNVTHEVRTLADSQLRVIHIHADRNPFSGKHCLVLEVSRLLKELIASLEILDTPGPRENHMTQVIIDELQTAKTLPIHLPMPTDKRLKGLCEILLANPASNDTLDVLAKQVGASSRTLTRLFEQDLNMSFGTWRQQMRLARVTPLISRGLPLSQVATELGYASQSAFSAMFKKTFGESPSAFFSKK